MLRRPAGRSEAMLGLLAVALFLSACGSSDDRATTSTSVPATTTTIPTADVAILDSYRASYDDFLAMGNPIDPFNPRLGNHMADRELSQTQNALFSRKSAGQVIKGTVDLSPKVTSNTGSDAVVADCYLDKTQAYDAATDAPQGTLDTERQLVEARMSLRDGTWKVTAIEHKGSGCAAG
jgi:hypothetical protein